MAFLFQMLHEDAGTVAFRLFRSDIPEGAYMQFSKLKNDLRHCTTFTS